MKKWKKITIGVVGGVILLLATGVWYGVTPIDAFYEIHGNLVWKYWEWKAKRLERAYEKDTYGGKTPEETLALFIGALKRQDFDLASKYYIVERQKEIRDSLEDAPYLDEYISIVETYERDGSKGWNDNLYTIDFYKDGEQVHFENFVFNEYTGVWKLSSPQ